MSTSTESYDLLVNVSANDVVPETQEQSDPPCSARWVKRRYLCHYSASLNENDKIPIPSMAHFDVRVETEESATDHLRLYVRPMHTVCFL